MNYTKLNKFKETTGKSYEQTASTTRDNFFISSVSTHVWKKKKMFSSRSNINIDVGLDLFSLVQSFQRGQREIWVGRKKYRRASL